MNLLTIFKLKKTKPEDNNLQKKLSLEATIKLLEQQLKEQRDKSIEVIKQKESELAKLKIYLEAIDNKSNANKQTQVQELKEIQDDFKTQFEKLKHLIDTTKQSWSTKIESKKTEIKQLQDETATNELKLKQDLEHKKETIEKEIGNLKLEATTLLRKLKQEQEIYNKKVLELEREINAVKGEIAVKDAQRRSDAEKHNIAVQEMRVKLSEQLKLLEEKFKTELETWQKEYRNKERELIAFKAQAQQKQSDLQLTYESEYGKLERERDECLNEIAEIKNKIQTAEERYKQNIALLTEEANKVKIELMLKEAEEKSEREKKQAELQNELKNLGSQIDQLQQKLLEDSENYNQLIQAKENELQAFRTETETKLKELEEEQQKKIAALAKEVEAGKKELQLLKTKLVENKNSYDLQLKEKKAQLETVKQEHQKK
ncbi:MAG: hypothetical protein QME68_01510, partial [Elusimicrobiota bacterium]|nr:hypothetical protein [Elusimicrobiota bacterium]